MVELLRRLDTNGDGMISVQELRDFMEKHCAVFDKDKCEAFIRNHDEDHDGMLSLIEFKEAMER